MQLDRRKQMILKALPERKKTSKKLKQQVLEDIYYHASSLPQKKSLQVRQASSSLQKRYSEIKGQPNEFSNQQNQKIVGEQKQSFLVNQKVQRKNQSLPKNLHPNEKIIHQSTQVFLPNTKKSDHQKTKVKKFSHKQQRTPLTQSQQKYRLKTLQDILKKKDSKRLIRESFLHCNIKNSPVEETQQKIKTKQNKMMNMKHAFQNRKFTNLSKYKMSTGSKNNDLFGEGRNEDRRQSNYMSRKVSKQNSKKRIKTQHQEAADRQFLLLQEKRNAIQEFENKVIKDLDLTEYIDSENIISKDSKKNITTLEDSFKQAFSILKNYSEWDKFDRKEDMNLQKALILLKNIEKQTGSLSKKTSLMLGKINFYLAEFNNSIYYLENVFKQSNYDLQCIGSLKSLQNQENLWSFYSDFYFILGESYKKTQNFLCTIKILDQWQNHVVKKIVQNIKNKETFNNDSKKQTISQIDSTFKYKSQIRQNTIEQDDENDSERIFQELQQKKRSHSIIRENTSNYFVSAVKQKQRTQSLIKRQTIKYKNHHFSLKPKPRHLSIKTLSEINVNLDAQNQNNVVNTEDLQKCIEKMFLKNGYLMRARIQFQIKNFYASIQDYLKVLACDSINIEAGLQLATLYYKIGRKDKVVSFLYDFLQQMKQSLKNSCEQLPIQQVKYHLAVMLYKSQKYQQSIKLFCSMEKQSENLDFMGQIFFYEALNLIKIKKIFSYQQFKQTDKNKQKQHTKNIQDILVSLQKSIDLSPSDFYIYAAYFLKIYIFIFQLKHYYGAQYEIDRLKASIERKKAMIKKKSSLKQIEKQTVNYRIVSVEFFAKIINLNDLIQITSGIICILKLKLIKGLELITQVQRKVKFNKGLLATEILGIENQQLSQLNEGEQKYQLNQILKLIYQFKYYGHYTMRNYRNGLGYLQRIKEIDMFSEKQTKIHLRINNQERQISKHQHFKDQSDRVNYLTLQSLILIDQKKFEDALNVLKIIEIQSSQSQGKKLKTHKKTKSGNMDTISTVIQIKKQGNAVQITKSLCYILLYKYLESQKLRQINTKRSIDQRQIKISENSNQERQQCQQRNDEILLVAEDLLSQCLICDQENFQILFLISLIHYELKRYDSALNYIRQAIQLSDDHMIKHYYLKANMKLLLGKYQQAIKDYSNAITVFKEFEKEKDESNKPFESGQKNVNKKTINIVEENLSFQSHSILKSSAFQNQQSNILTSRSQNSLQDLNEYYEEQQEMHPQIYLNRAISYIKYAYNLQYEACHQNKKVKSRLNSQSYHSVRQSIINLKSAAGQDVKQYFTEVMNNLKARAQAENMKKRKTKDSQSLHGTIEKSPKRNEKSPKRSVPNTSKAQYLELTKVAKHLRLFLHTSDLQTMLQVSKQFSKEFGVKLLSEQELMKYFYLAKQLNNCLNLMDKIIKKHYLSERTQRQENIQQNQLKKYSSSKVVDPIIDNEPYFKSKKDHKMSRANNYSQYNVQKYSTKLLNNEKNSQQKELALQTTKKQQQRIQRLILDKKILSALKDSSNNRKQDYENALVILLQAEENIEKCYSTGVDERHYECGDIFKYSDLVFFIGVMYYLLQDYHRCLRYFEKSFQLKTQTFQLMSLKNVVTKAFVRSSNNQDDDDSSSQRNTSQVHELSLSNLRQFQEIYDNRIYSKQEIKYNIGVVHLLIGDYNSAYDYLESYDDFVALIQNALTLINDQESPQNLDKNKKNKIKKTKNLDKLTQQLLQKQLDQISIKTKNNIEQDEETPDITPFPIHNRLCSIYPPKEINGNKFTISFCLPKLQLPHLGIFNSDEIQIAQHEKKQNQQNILDSIDDEKQDKTMKNDKKLYLLDQQSDDPTSNGLNQEKFVIKKQNIVNFLDIVTLKDIAMKPIAPWIKKDKQKKCIRFTDNFLSQSFDFMTECATQRRPKNTSRKEMFSQHKNHENEEIDFEKDYYRNTKDEDEDEQNFKKQQQIKKTYDQNPNFLKNKEKQKPNNKRYETIEND